jgi:hypothetical protein
MPNGLFGDANGFGALAAGAADSIVVGGGSGGGGAVGAHANGELGLLKIDGTAGCGGAAGGGGGAGAGGLVKGSGYSGIELAAAENGFAEGMYCDCSAGAQSGVVGVGAGAQSGVVDGACGAA